MKNLDELIKIGFDNLSKAKKSNDDFFYTLSIKAFEECIDKYPNSHMPLLGLGVVMNSMGKYKKSIKFYNKGLKPSFYVNNKITAILLVGRGMSYCKIGEKEKALIDYENSIVLNVNSHSPYNMIGILKNSLGEYMEAIEYFEKSIELCKIYTIDTIKKSFKIANENLDILLEEISNNQSNIRFGRERLN